MIGLPQTATGRIAFAITLSVALHLVLLFGPDIELPHHETLLPPLQAKLEPLPKSGKKTQKKKPASHPLPAPVAPQPVAPPADSIPPAPLADAASAVPEVPEVPEIIEPAKPAEEYRAAHPLPKHAQLDFIAYKGSSFKVGEAHHWLEIGADGAYTIDVSVYTTGVAKLLKTFVMTQSSTGTLTAQGGLRPDVYRETRNSSQGRESIEAKFDWPGMNLSFANGQRAALSEQAQDMLSVMYQLSQLPLDQGMISLQISNGKKLDHYELSVGEVREIDSGLGKIHALPLRKIHAPGEDDLEFWLGVEYRLLPVKVVQYDRDGDVVAEMVISAIRLADE